MSRPDGNPAALVPDDEVFIRMGRAERWQHGLLIASFSVLALTGLPLLVGWGRGAAWRGLLHRAAAAVFIADIVWHLLYSFLTVRGRQNFRDRLPGLEDIRAGLALFHARLPRAESGRYGFLEKLDYWSFIVGSAVMMVTGVLIGAPELSLKLFPLALHQAFVVIHGGEAVLAVLSIMTWHAYAVHLNPAVFPMSRVWLDGRMTGADLRRFHPLEYRRIMEERRADRLATGEPEKSITEEE